MKKTHGNRAGRFAVILIAMVTLLMLADRAPAQSITNEPLSINPIQVLEDAADAVPGFERGLSGALNILILMTVLTLAPSIVIMCTSFTRIVIVLSLMRQAMGTQSVPPSQVVVGVSLLLTFLIMAPTITRVYDEAIIPYREGDPEVTSQLDVWNRARIPLRDFMFSQLEATGNWEGVYMILEYRGYDVSDPSQLSRGDVDMLTLVPSFMMSELKVAFLLGFRIYLPFLVIDMVIASLLISMGMLMLPPILISLPFKLLLFVLVDGWNLIVSNLLTGFAQPETTVGSAITTFTRLIT